MGVFMGIINGHGVGSDALFSPTRRQAGLGMTAQATARQRRTWQTMDGGVMTRLASSMVQRGVGRRGQLVLIRQTRRPVGQRQTSDQTTERQLISVVGEQWRDRRGDQ